MVKRNEIACIVERNNETIEKQNSKLTVPHNILQQYTIMVQWGDLCVWAT